LRHRNPAQGEGRRIVSQRHALERPERIPGGKQSSTGSDDGIHAVSMWQTELLENQLQADPQAHVGEILQPIVAQFRIGDVHEAHAAEVDFAKHVASLQHAQ